LLVVVLMLSETPGIDAFPLLGRDRKSRSRSNLPDLDTDESRRGGAHLSTEADRISERTDPNLAIRDPLASQTAGELLIEKDAHSRSVPRGLPRALRLLDRAKPRGSRPGTRSGSGHPSGSRSGCVGGRGYRRRRCSAENFRIVVPDWIIFAGVFHRF